MVTLSIAELNGEISALLRGAFNARGIRFGQNLARGDRDYILLAPNTQKSCDVLLIDTPLPDVYIRADYITLINSDEKLVHAVNKKSLVVTYGLNSLATVTASSIRAEMDQTEFLCCIQRSVVTLKGKLLEPQEFPVKIAGTPPDIHACMGFVALGLILSFSPADFSDLPLSSR